jgi:hypothetical protein
MLQKDAREQQETKVLIKHTRLRLYVVPPISKLFLDRLSLSLEECLNSKCSKTAIAQIWRLT